MSSFNDYLSEKGADTPDQRLNKLPVVYTPFLKFQHPCIISIFGPSMAGKTNLALNIAQQSQDLFSPPPAKIYYFYGEWQNSFEKDIPNLEFIQGFPDINFLKSDPNIPKLCFFDDLLDSISNSNDFVDLCTKHAHHYSISCCILSQYIFHDKRRICRAQNTYTFLMKMPQDRLSPATLARQVFPGRVSQFIEAYEHSTRLPYSYLFLDFHPLCPDEYRIRSLVLPTDKAQVVYNLKHKKK